MIYCESGSMLKHRHFLIFWLIKLKKKSKQETKIMSAPTSELSFWKTASSELHDLCCCIEDLHFWENICNVPLEQSYILTSQKCIYLVAPRLWLKIMEKPNEFSWEIWKGETKMYGVATGTISDQSIAKKSLRMGGTEPFCNSLNTSLEPPRLGF